MVGFTWSMVADFYAKIQDEIDFRKQTNDTNPLSDGDIKTIFTNLHISREDFEQQKKQTEEWLARVRNGVQKQRPGFL